MGRNACAFPDQADEINWQKDMPQEKMDGSGSK